MKKFLLVLALPLQALDCAANCMIGGSIKKTLSGEAWYHRDHKYWGWCYTFINTLFFWQDDHCHAQAIQEQEFGSMWGAWKDDWNNS